MHRRSFVYLGILLKWHEFHRILSVCHQVHTFSLSFAIKDAYLLKNFIYSYHNVSQSNGRRCSEILLLLLCFCHANRELIISLILVPIHEKKMYLSVTPRHATEHFYNWDSTDNLVFVVKSRKTLLRNLYTCVRKLIWEKVGCTPCLSMTIQLFISFSLC